MPSKANQQQVAELKDVLKDAKSVAIVEYSGTSVNDQVALRSALRKVGGEMRVAKNTLMKLALGKDELAESFEGMNALVMSFTDEVSAIKELFKFHKDSEKLTIKQGVLEDKVLSAEDVKNLSAMPSKDELVATLISRIKGPSYGLVNVLQASQRNLVYALQAIADKKGSE